MLLLRFFCQNNEMESFLILCNIIEHCSQIPPEFPEFSRLMRLIFVLCVGRRLTRRIFSKKERSFESERCSLSCF